MCKPIFDRCLLKILAGYFNNPFLPAHERDLMRIKTVWYRWKAGGELFIPCQCHPLPKIPKVKYCPDILFYTYISQIFVRIFNFEHDSSLDCLYVLAACSVKQQFQTVQLTLFFIFCSDKYGQMSPMNNRSLVFMLRAFHFYVCSMVL